MNYEERDPSGMYKASTTTASGPDSRHGPGPYLMGADTLVGNDVFNKDSEDLGDIKEIMLDMRSGRVSYAVLSFGGFLGMGEKLFAVPFSALAYDLEENEYVLDISKERLETAPGFDPDQWPAMSDEKWNRDVYKHYDRSPYWE